MRNRYSLQRELIYDTVYSEPVHPTAEMVYHRLKPKYKNLSLGTVYRNLQKLTDEGKLRRFSLDGIVLRYDADTTPHYHAVCLKCGEIFDIHGSENLVSIFADKINGEIISHDITINILCADCGFRN